MRGTWNSYLEHVAVVKYGVTFPIVVCSAAAVGSFGIDGSAK